MHDIQACFDVSLVFPRLLTEKIVKRSGYVWKFNKTDADPWPSVLHGSAITGLGA